MKNLVVATAMMVGSYGVYADGHSSHGDKKNEHHNVRFDYDVGISYDDHGYSKTDSVTPDKVAHVHQTSYINFSGVVSDSLSYEVYYNLLADSPNAATEVAKATKKMGMFSIAAGRDYLNIGGFDAKNNNFATLALSPYTRHNMPGLGPDQIRFEGDFAAAGKVSLSLTQDKIYSTAKTSTLQPAMLLEWTGDFGPVSPLVQVASYDSGHSNQIALGAAVHAAGLTAYLDYIMDTRAHAKVGDADRESTTYTSYSVDVKYHMPSLVPFLKVGSFDAAQPGTDLEGNASKDGFADNGTEMAVGVEFPCTNETFLPYIAYVNGSQKVLEGTDTKTKSEAKVILGFSGSI